MADATTQQPTTQPAAIPPTPPPVEKPAALEQPPRPEAQPSAEGSDVELQVKTSEAEGKKAVEDEIGAFAVQEFLAMEKVLADPNTNAQAEAALTKTLGFIQEKYQGDPVVANLPEALKDLRLLVSANLLKGFPTEPQPGYRDARREVLVSLMNVMLRGHLNAEEMQYLVKNGIVYREEPRENTDHNVEWVGYFDAQTKTIEVYPRLFKIVSEEDQKAGHIEARTEATLLHELGHAMDGADGLVFPNADLRAIADHPEGQTRPQGLTDIEWRTFQRMLMSPDQARPWLPRYISAKLESYGTQQRSAETNYELITETKTEWLRIFMETDGSFGNFMLKLLENCSFVQHYLEQRQQPGYVPKPLAGGEVARALYNFANNLQVSQHPETIEAEIRTFMATHLNDPQFEPYHDQITDIFLLGSSLYLRFSRMRGKVQLPTGQIVDRRKSVSQALGQGKYADNPNMPGFRDSAGVGHTGSRPKEQSIWNVIIAAILDFPTS